MRTLSQAQKILRFLEAHSGQSFTARQIATFLITEYPAEYARKRRNPRFADDKAFLSQIIAEIGSQKDTLIRGNPALTWQDRPKPRRYCIPLPAGASTEQACSAEVAANAEQPGDAALQEQALYPLLISYLSSELRLYSLRIRESCSHNARGAGGNQWLHPDVAAMEPVDEKWNKYTRQCVKLNGSTSVRLWSFEVKKTLTLGNVRKCFFQAVSNSSWAHEGYLVATGIAEERVEQELRMLSSLHGIGVILLDPENPSESEIFLPARRRIDADWQSIDRLVKENSDFQEYMELVSAYLQTERLRERDWNR
ncbi:HrgA protein [Desulfovibrio sp. ZJ369]|uniref:COG2958 family protein n=1 Tax=Desulfovibrio sp. ZJ369 TaxID=2709793 RepID=UPI0013ECF5FB|nr:HrgA protein [Desulfovibrio sp. ZJ369]